jgi:hypothetical protein
MLSHSQPAVILAAALAAAPLQGQPAQSFEGVVRYTVQVEGERSEMLYMAKGSKARNEVRMGRRQFIMLTDLATGQVMTLDPESKSYTVIDASDDDDSDLPKITATGRSETILGYKCEHYLVDSEEVKADICAAKGMGFFSSQEMSWARRSASAQRELAAKNPEYAKILKEGFLPLKFTVTDPDTKEQSVVEATSIERKTLPAALFAPPAGYRRVQLPGESPGGTPGQVPTRPPARL